MDRFVEPDFLEVDGEWDWADWDNLDISAQLQLILTNIDHRLFFKHLEYHSFGDDHYSKLLDARLAGGWSVVMQPDLTMFYLVAGHEFELLDEWCPSLKAKQQALTYIAREIGLIVARGGYDD